jgi:outer membrane murein-binding lipoprotein Lpp
MIRFYEGGASVYCAARNESFKYNELRSNVQRLNAVVHKIIGTDIMKHTTIQIT